MGCEPSQLGPQTQRGSARCPSPPRPHPSLPPGHLWVSRWCLLDPRPGLFLQRRALGGLGAGAGWSPHTVEGPLSPSPHTDLRRTVRQSTQAWTPCTVPASPGAQSAPSDRQRQFGGHLLGLPHAPSSSARLPTASEHPGPPSGGLGRRRPSPACVRPCAQCPVRCRVGSHVRGHSPVSGRRRAEGPSCGRSGLSTPEDVWVAAVRSGPRRGLALPPLWSPALRPLAVQPRGAPARAEPGWGPAPALPPCWSLSCHRPSWGLGLLSRWPGLGSWLHPTSCVSLKRSFDLLEPTSHLWTAGSQIFPAH